MIYNIFKQILLIFQFLYNLVIKKNKIKINKRDLIEEYKTKYNDKYNLQKTTEVTNERLNQLKNCFIYEFTPLGNIIMYFDGETNTFNHHTDKNIPYSFLESVCRKYVCTFDCKCLYVDMEKEIKKIEELKEKKNENANIKENETSKKNNFLVTPKSYNKPNKKKQRANVNDNKKKINNYKNCGKINQFNFVKTKSKSKSLNIKNISFSEFKNRNNI